MDFVALWHVESSWARDWTCVPALTGRFLSTVPPGGRKVQESFIYLVLAKMCSLGGGGFPFILIKGAFGAARIWRRILWTACFSPCRWAAGSGEAKTQAHCWCMAKDAAEALPQRCLLGCVAPGCWWRHRDYLGPEDLFLYSSVYSCWQRSV